MPYHLDRKSTRLNSSHTIISYAVFCLKKKKGERTESGTATDTGEPARTRATRGTSRLRPPPRPHGPPLPPLLLSPPLCFFFLMIRRPPRSPLFPYTTLSRSNDTATTEIYTLSLQTSSDLGGRRIIGSEEHTSELQSPDNLVCRLLLEKKNPGTFGRAEPYSPESYEPCPDLQPEETESSSKSFF